MVISKEYKHEWRQASYGEDREKLKSMGFSYASGMQGIYLICVHCGGLSIKGGKPSWPYDTAPVIDPDPNDLKNYNLQELCFSREKVIKLKMLW